MTQRLKSSGARSRRDGNSPRFVFRRNDAAAVPSLTTRCRSPARRQRPVASGSPLVKRAAGDSACQVAERTLLDQRLFLVTESLSPARISLEQFDMLVEHALLTQQRVVEVREQRPFRGVRVMLA